MIPDTHRYKPKPRTEDIFIVKGLHSCIISLSVLFCIHKRISSCICSFYPSQRCQLHHCCEYSDTMHIFASVLFFLGLLCAGTAGYKSKYSLATLRPQRLSTELNAEAKKSTLVNEEIQHPVVRLLVPKSDDSGDDEMIGVFPIEKALEEARQRELDLVLINERSDPPVCKVVDAGKFNYMVEKRRKEQSKKQIKVETKEIKLSPSIEQHDFDVRVRAALKFLADGDRVKTVVQFKGREMQHTSKGRDLLLRFFEQLQEGAVLDAQPKMEGRSMLMTISPKKSAR